MLSKPVTFMFCELSTDLIGVNQLTAFGSGIPLFDLCTSVGQPFLVLVKQLQSPLDYLIRVVKRSSPEHLVDQFLILWPEGDCHVTFSWVSGYPDSEVWVKAMKHDLKNVSRKFQRYKLSRCSNSLGKGPA